MGGNPSRRHETGHQRLRPLLRAAVRRHGDDLRQRLRLQHHAAGTGRGPPRTVSSGPRRSSRRSSGGSSSGSGTRQCKPASIAEHRAIQAVDPDALSDEELADYLTRCRDHHAAMMAQHMRFTAGAMIPTGDFLVHVGGWTGLPPAELLGLLRGSASVSAGGSTELERLIAAIGDDPAALDSSIRATTPPRCSMRCAPSEVSGERSSPATSTSSVTGPSTDSTSPNPAPWRCPTPCSGPSGSRSKGGTGGLGGRGPDGRRPQPGPRTAPATEFDELLGEARLTYRLRDERGVYSDIWASGLMRRAVLAAGRRLAARGQITDPEHLVDATLGEMCALVSGSGGPSAEELVRRSEYRATHTAKEAPPVMGTPPPPPRTRPGCHRPWPA